MNLSIKNVPQQLATRLRERAARNHQSLQKELMAILERAADVTATGGLMERLAAIAGDRGINTAKRLTREQCHDRKALRKAG